MSGSVCKYVWHNNGKKTVKYSGFKEVLSCTAYNLEFTV